MANTGVNLHQVKQVSITLLNAVKLEPHEYIPIVAQHPFTSSMVGSALVDGKPQILDLNDDTNKQIWFKHIENMINTSDDLVSIYLLVNKPYRMLWLKLIKVWLSKEVFSEYLKEIWIGTDNPNQDVNVPLTEISKFFKYADKSHLMNESEYNYYKAIPQTVKLWRGVATGRTKDGFSWTNNRETAEWFAKRWNRGGVIYEITANKDDIFAYFEGEHEFVIDPSKYTMNVVSEFSSKEAV